MKYKNLDLLKYEAQTIQELWGLKEGLERPSVHVGRPSEAGFWKERGCRAVHDCPARTPRMQMPRPKDPEVRGSRLTPGLQSFPGLTRLSLTMADCASGG